MVVWIASAVICLYAGKGELVGDLDQGDLIHERSIGVGVGVALPDRTGYPGSLSTMDCMASSLLENICSRVRFYDSSWLSFSALCSSCLECSSSFSFKLWTSEESSGFSATSIRAQFSSVT
ncbi:hypothetical protein F2Q70_00025906 [Brassica cretica]|uniref:Secreted protein n=1 Tax=Brassica cretica TaxID=69181 RepID=A0A8S9L2N4_BRACR|nr:hypothetical protein F2Q70_00025906 [Brassica cretica]